MQHIARDSFFDILKGIAILLVILGHTIQGLDINFDNNIFFNVIYSFHMPLFIFTSGAVLSLKYNNLYKISEEPFSNFLQNLKKVLLRLLLPFVSWTLIMFYTGHRYESMSLVEWLIMVGKQVDYSLWFLLAILYCLMFFYFTKFLFESMIKDINPLNLFIFSFIAFILLYKFIPSIFGTYFFKMYYFYFVLGAVWNLKLKHHTSVLSKYAPLVIFSILIPLWTRTEPVFSYTLLELVYRTVVAIAGIFIIINVANMINSSQIKLLKNVLAFCGVASLGIYAIHFNFLGFKPHFLIPLTASLAVVWLLRKSNVLSCTLLGECKKRGISL